MQIFELSHPELEVSVRYKILAPPEAEMLASERFSMPRDNYMRWALEAVLYNLGEITENLRAIDRDSAKNILTSLYNGCVMLNPGIDPEMWVHIAGRTNADTDAAPNRPKRAVRKKRVTEKKALASVSIPKMEAQLKERVIGQDPAIDTLLEALKRSLAGLGDDNRPMGVFLFAGASGVGKTRLAVELHNYIFGDSQPVRIDCGEYQHKHDNSKLIGAPPGYVGHDETAALPKLMEECGGKTVVLLDEVEKAHADIWHTFLRVFDEGILTDARGNVIDFRKSIIIMTTNLGNQKVVEEIQSRKFGFALSEQTDLPPRARIERLALEEIRKRFLPELLNRIDKTIVFNHLTEVDLRKIAELELETIDTKLSKSGFSLHYDDSAANAMAHSSITDVQGARCLSQIRRDQIENKLADSILADKPARGTIFSLTWNTDNGYVISSYNPSKVKKAL